MDVFLTKISESIKHFQPEQLVMLNATTCEKVIPIYSLFSESESWGNIELLQEALFLQYQYLQNLTITDSEIDKIILEIENNSPDLDEFNSELASYALDACIVFMESLTFLRTKDINSAISVASSSRDLVDMFVQEKNDFAPNDVNLNIKIQTDPFMEKEVDRYFTLISKIGTYKNLNLSEIEAVRILNNEYGEIIDNKILTKLYLS
ncbi:MAG: DUF416 family protein [Spirosomataceae bacterium]